MTVSGPLSHFLQETPAADLNNCDREPVHLIGTLQNVGGLLILDPSDLRILGGSENLEERLGVPLDDILNTHLAVFDADIAAEIEQSESDLGTNYQLLITQITHKDAVFDVVTHAFGGFRFLEFIPSDEPSPMVARKNMRTCSKACAQIMATDSLDSATRIAADAVRAITGFSRVNIYKFLPDWSGAVVAESRDGVLPAFLGLHFPATDIPKQAREMMRMVPYRFIGTVHDDNIPLRLLPEMPDVLDMTWCLTRSISAMHTAYLRNLEVEATFACSLMINDRLWGLIACHDVNRRVVSADTWSLAQEIGSALMLRQEQETRKKTTDIISELRYIESGFVAEMRKSGKVEDVIEQIVPVLQNFLRADGFAFQYGSKIMTSGETPPEDFIRDLVQWSQRNMSASDQFQTSQLHTVYPDAKPFMEIACGVLVQPILTHRICQLLWFRAPITRKVQWAGQPDSSKLIDAKTGAILGPRTSFDRWVQEHRDQSLPWEPAELEAAREIFKEFLDIVAAQVLLKEENASLQQFAQLAAHDIKQPLQGITQALDWIAEDRDNQSRNRRTMEMVGKNAKRLTDLTESILQMSLIGQEQTVFTPIDLSQVAHNSLELLQHQIAGSEAQIDIGPLPVVDGVKIQLERVFFNVLSNAIKYQSGDRALVVKVAARQMENGTVQIEVTDNGSGIDPQFADRVFEPMKRLVGGDIDGSGIGLTLCKRIMELHNGRIYLDTAHTDGARFVLEFPARA